MLSIFSSSFLFGIAIIVILIGGLFAYVTYRMSVQDAKLQSMVGIISVLAGDMQNLRGGMMSNNSELKNKTDLINELEDYECEDVEDDDGCEDDCEDDCEDEGLISVSDNEDFEDDYEEKNSENELEDLEEMEDLDVHEFEEMSEYQSEKEKDEYKVIHIDLDGISDKPLFDNLIIPKTDEIQENYDFKEQQNVTDANDLSLNDIVLVDNETKYKKLSLNKLREIVVTKGLVSDASKLKKNDLLKLLGEE
jgi:hypothetical protein